VLALVAAGCGHFSAAPPPPLVVAPPVVVPAVRAARPPAPRHLACIEDPRIDVWERRLRSNPDLRQSVRETLVRARWYLPRVRRIFVKQGLPASLALLPVIESEFYRTAQGQLDDRGLWQLRVATAQQYGLVVNARRDQRLHPYHASRAAARYLHALHRRYHDWPLALAAYNAGENRIDRLRGCIPRATFWELVDMGQLPSTTADYVPRFLALVRITDGTTVCNSEPAVQMARTKPAPTALAAAQTRRTQSPCTGGSAPVGADSAARARNSGLGL